MAGKITDLAELTSGNIADGDLAVVVDVSDTSMAGTGTNKKTLWSSIKAQLKTYFDTLYPPKPKYVRLSANRTSTSTSLADVTDMTVSIEANKVYRLKACIRYKGSVSTEAIGLSINGPASPTSVEFMVQAGANTTILRFEHVSTYDTVVMGVSSLTTSLPAFIDALIVNGANAGTLAIRFKAETGGANSVTVEAGSWLILEEVEAA